MPRWKYLRQRDVRAMTLAELQGDLAYCSLRATSGARQARKTWAQRAREVEQEIARRTEGVDEE